MSDHLFRRIVDILGKKFPLNNNQQNMDISPGQKFNHWTRQLSSVENPSVCVHATEKQSKQQFSGLDFQSEFFHEPKILFQFFKSYYSSQTIWVEKAHFTVYR